MSIELFRPRPEDAEALGEICYRAFGTIFARFGLESDFPNVARAQDMIRMMCARPDVYAVAARANGKPAGSNFLHLSDPVAGVGPITVSPDAQARGIGRALMADVIEYARKHLRPQVRLVQDAVNVVSLSLYTELGFAVTEPLAMVTIPPAQRKDPAVRPATLDDLDRLDELCQRIYRVSRRNELADLITHGTDHALPVYLRQRDGSVRAYAVPGFLGHGVGETNEDLLATVQQARTAQPDGLGNPMQSILCPSRNADLYRAILKAGGQTIRCLHLMATGPYEAPSGAWYPSITY